MLCFFDGFQRLRSTKGIQSGGLQGFSSPAQFHAPAFINPGLLVGRWLPGMIPQSRLWGRSSYCQIIIISFW
jgi:hypothetical protein